MKKHVFIYEDTLETLEHLSKKYKLIIISKSKEKFLKIKLEAEGLNKYFYKVFSVPSDLKMQQKNKEAYAKVLEILNIKNKDIVHIGDDHNKDYEVPSSIGIKSYHLVRSKEIKAEHVIHSLLELKRLL